MSATRMAVDRAMNGASQVSNASNGPAVRPIDAHPGFAAAVRNSTTGPLALLDRDPRFYRCIGDIPSYALGVLALYLHSIDRLYHRGLRAVSKDLFSPGRASAILSRMQTTGLIAPLDDFAKGRQRRYSPAPAMIEAFRACHRIELQSLALIDERAGALLDAFDDPAVFDGIIAFLATRHLAAPTLDEDLIDPLGGVGRRSMGLMLSYALAEAAFNAGLPRAVGTVPVTVSSLARRLGMSRPHCRRVLMMLQDAGLVSFDQGVNALTLMPAFADAVDVYFVGLFGALLAAVDQISGERRSAVP